MVFIQQLICNITKNIDCEQYSIKENYVISFLIALFMTVLLKNLKQSEFERRSKYSIQTGTCKRFEELCKSKVFILKAP